MNWKSWMPVAAMIVAQSMFCGSLSAQVDGESDLEAQIDAEMAKNDANSDGKVTMAEFKAVTKADSGIEDEGSYEWLDAWKYSLIDFLAADGDDNLEATKAELLTYYKRMQSGESEKMGKLTKKDISVLDDEYLEPAVALMLKLFDTDGNGKVSQKEGDAAEMGEVVKEYDTNKDGNLDGREIKESEIVAIGSLYDVEAGYTLRGEASTAETAPVEIPEAVRKEFNLVDSNKDGFVDKDEMKKARTKGQTNKAYWWGVYIAYLSIDADDDLKVTVEEFAQYASDENSGVAHKFYPVDRTEAMNEIWLDLDGNADGKVTKDEFAKLFPDSDEFGGIDANNSGDVSKDEMFDALKGQFGESFEFPEKDRDAGSAIDTPSNGGGTPNADDQMWNLYKKVGRSWTIKNSSEFMGMVTVSYMKTEVIKLEADHCVIRVTMLDAEKKESPYMKPTETKIEFKTASGGGTPANAPKIKDLGTETIKVEAGEYECKVTEVVTEAAGATYTTKSWSSTKHAGLSVKSETTSKDMTAKSELVEFVE